MNHHTMVSASTNVICQIPITTTIKILDEDENVLTSTSINRTNDVNYYNNTYTYTDTITHNDTDDLRK